ncbi:MAG TPA: class I SAM-dependent methyltransferase [Steroidobacteraceae bacterium]|nr:class I SAM-dependent methyltransferase [Steroidobacteraceae bacterium]
MAKPLVTGLGFVCLLLAGAWAQAPSTHEHSFSGAEHWAKVFDDPARDSWQRPHEVIQALALAADSVVADIGAGTGYFTVRIAHMTPAGRVYAVDIEPDMIQHLAVRARRENLQNVTPLLAEPSDPMLPAPVDLALLVDTYHHIGDRVAYFRRLKGHLKPAGTVAIIDFTADSPIGPPAAGRVAPDEVKKEMSRAGYALASEHKFLPNQYFLVFRQRAE